MTYLDQELERWGEELSNIELPRWSSLPDFDLYMDQVITIVNESLSFLEPESKGALLTPAMVNNYVKLKVIPKPVKKRYHRTHLAFLITIVLLKPVLSIGDIHDGIRMQVKAFKGNVQGAYDLFIKQLEKNFHSVAEIAKNNPEITSFVYHLPVSMRGIYMITYACASKLYAEKVLQIERAHREMQKEDSTREVKDL